LYLNAAIRKQSYERQTLLRGGRGGRGGNPLLNFQLYAAIRKMRALSGNPFLT
jgi:hypothetical protein